jgi:hypothetical protein
MSAFQLPSSNLDVTAMAPLMFDLFEFKHTYCIIGSSGDITVMQNPAMETILVGNDWQQHRKGGQPTGTYIGEGYSKFAFRVCVYGFICIHASYLHLQGIL